MAVWKCPACGKTTLTGGAKRKLPPKCPWCKARMKYLGNLERKPMPAYRGMPSYGKRKD